MILIDGKKVAQETRVAIKERVEKLAEKGVVPGLAVIIVGNNPASEAYVGMKSKACDKLGVYSETHKLREETTHEELIQLIEKLNNQKAINGILVQLPLPAHIDENKVLKAILPEKDVDGFHPENVGKLSIGDEGFIPCTPYGVIKLLEAYDIETEGKNAVIIGRSNIVGKPIAMLMLERNATVTICHSRTKNLSEIASQADILIVAIGRPGFVTADMVKEGAVIIDVGINRIETGLVGDVDFESVKDKAGYVTPVPKGVGPMTITMLLYNTVLSAERANSI